MDNIIKVGMADLKVTTCPNSLITLGLGSCVGIALYDTKTKIIGLAHIMLPDSTQVKSNQVIAKFADTGIKKLLDNMLEIGAIRSKIVAKLAGGAQMFATSYSDIMGIGPRNVAASKKVLEDLKIPIISEDTGGNYGRTIELYSDRGMLLVKTIGQGIREI